jgi:hypothetical protein
MSDVFALERQQRAFTCTQAGSRALINSRGAVLHLIWLSSP